VGFVLQKYVEKEKSRDKGREMGLGL